jgi:ribonuclease-3
VETNKRRAAIEALQARLGHKFTDYTLLERALTHASASGGGVRVADNERLEFLGDRVLGLAVAAALMTRDRESGAGPLAKQFASLVSRDSCARVARSIGLGEALRLAGGETRRGARDHETIIADACEAVIAALYLELGFEGAAEIVLRLWAPLLDEGVDLDRANPKSALQERAAARGLPAPTYHMTSRTGPDHQPFFQVEVRLGEMAHATGEGGSLQAAQKAAAACLLDQLRNLP